MQMLFLLIISGAYIPSDVKAVIKGPKVSLDFYVYTPTPKLRFYNSIISKFSFDETNPLLEEIGVDSDSSLYNMHFMLT